MHPAARCSRQACSWPPLAVTEKNTRIVRDWARRPEIPVYAGSPRPLVRDPIFADDVHGKTGMDGPALHEPRGPLAPVHAVQYLVDTLRAAATAGHARAHRIDPCARQQRRQGGGRHPGLRDGVCSAAPRRGRRTDVRPLRDRRSPT